MKGCLALSVVILGILFIASRSIVTTSILISILFLWFIGYVSYRCWKDDIRYVSSRKKKIILLIENVLYFLIALTLIYFIGMNSGKDSEEYDYVDFMMDKAR